MRVGVAGLGRMGAAIAARLIDVGHQVHVWNRSPGKTDALVAGGATVAATPAELAGRCEAVISMLANAKALSDVYDGPQGIFAADVKGRTLIEMSTVQPHDEQALAATARTRGARFVECPVGGTVGPARNGQLLGVAGADQVDFAAARPLLDQLCRRVELVGPVGAGASLKLALNLPLLVYYQALAESYVLCRHLDLDPAWLMEFLAETSGGPNVLKVRGPAIATALSGGDTGPVTFDVDLCLKDLRTMLEEARLRGAAMPLTAGTLAVYEDAVAAGWGPRDAAWLPAWWPSQNPAK